MARRKGNGDITGKVRCSRCGSTLSALDFNVHKCADMRDLGTLPHDILRKLAYGQIDENEAWRLAETDQKLTDLATDARSIDDNDFGSERQVTAQNAFFTYVETQMHPMAFAEFEDWCLKATSDEMIDEALRLLSEE